MQQSYQPGAIVAPKPQRMLPTVPGQMARSIEGDGYNQYAPSSYGRATSPAPPPKQAGLYGSPGGGFPQMRVLSPAPSVGPPVPGAYPYGSPSLQPGQHLRPQSLADSPNRPLSAAPSLGAQMQAGYGQHSRPYSLSYGEPVNQNPGFHPGLEPRGGGGVPHSYSAQELAPPQIHGAHPGMRRASSSDAMNPMASHADSGAGGGPPNLNAPMPDMNSLASIREKAFASGDERRKLAWAKQLIKFVGRKHTDGAKISDPKLVQWIDEAIKVVSVELELAQCIYATLRRLKSAVLGIGAPSAPWGAHRESALPPGFASHAHHRSRPGRQIVPVANKPASQFLRTTQITKLANVNPPEPEALYMRGDLLASGSFPTYLPKNLKSAFNDFELAARMGWAASWFRIGRDYEVLGDIARARDAYERGISAGDVGSIYVSGAVLPFRFLEEEKRS